MNVLSALKFLVAADKAEVAAALAAVESPATVTRKPAKGKRTLTDEQKRKMAEGRKRAAAAKGKSVEKPAKAAKPAAAKPSRELPACGWKVTPHTTAKGVKGKIVQVGPFSTFLPAGDAAKRKAAAVAINGVFRTAEIGKVIAAVDA